MASAAPETQAAGNGGTQAGTIAASGDGKREKKSAHLLNHRLGDEEVAHLRARDLLNRSKRAYSPMITTCDTWTRW